MLEEDLVRFFLDNETKKNPELKGQPVITSIGTIAYTGHKIVPEVVWNLNTALLVEGIQSKTADLPSFPSDAELLKDNDWTVALILSPFKQSVVSACGGLAPMAEETDVADTLLRTNQGLWGVNINAYASRFTIESITNGVAPERVLIAGTGASARSIALGLDDIFPGTELAIWGRSREKAEKVVRDLDLGFGTVVDHPKDFQPDLLINATTVGEIDDTQSLEELEQAFAPRIRFFDLNTRVSILQEEALRSGCHVTNGEIMQNINKKLRVALLAQLLP